jgi:chromosome segregation ATPase
MDDDMTDTPQTLPASAAESAEQIRAQRAERQRQIRLLQLEQQIDDAKGRVERDHTRLAGSTERLEALEAELAELQQAAP